MSDHEMQFFSDNEQDPSSSQDWSPEQHSVSPESEPIAKADKQSLDLVWGRLEEHISRNRAYYQYNRHVPTLNVAFPPSEKVQQEHPTYLLRSFSWRRFDTIAAVLFLALLMGSLLTVVYQVQHATQLGSSGGDMSTDSVICETLRAQTQVVTIVEGQKGIEVQPQKIVVARGAQLIWINQTRGSQMIINANSKGMEIKIPFHEKVIADPLTQADTYSYYVQSLPLQKESSRFLETTRVVVKVVNLVLIVATAQRVVFQPAKMSLSRDATLVWLNTTQEKQIVSDMTIKQEPLTISPNSCRTQRKISSGNHLYQLQSSTSQFFLNAL